jgi:hypothetical protein
MRALDHRALRPQPLLSWLAILLSGATFNKAQLLWVMVWGGAVRWVRLWGGGRVRVNNGRGWRGRWDSALYWGTCAGSLARPKRPALFRKKSLAKKTKKRLSPKAAIKQELKIAAIRAAHAGVRRRGRAAAAPGLR